MTNSRNKMKTVSIIGAGPAGGYAAQLLAEAGYDVHVYEDHHCVGKPVACTGIVTKALWDLVPKKKNFLVNELSSVQVVAPNNKSVTIPLSEYVIDRAAFDPYLMNLAVKSGAQLHTGWRFVDKKGDTLVFRQNGKTVQKKTDVLIGADGPLSQVAKSAGIYGTREFWVGLQVTLERSWDPKKFVTYFGTVCPGFFAWAVPENARVARVGLAAHKHAKPLFDAFLAKLGGKVLDYQPGPIPWYSGNECVEKGNTYLVGDAAGLVKATTGGGIITGMLSAKILADCMITGKNYTKSLWQLKKELYVHKLLRRVLNNFSENDYNLLIEYMNTDGVKKILHEHPREFPSRFLLKLLVKQPKFLRFIPKIVS